VFALNDLKISTEALGQTCAFKRDGCDVELTIPSDLMKFDVPEEEFLVIWHELRHPDTNEPAPWRPVFAIRVVVRADAELGILDFEPNRDNAVTDRAVAHDQRTAALAEHVAMEFIDWARLHGQTQLGIHGQPPERIRRSLHDEDAQRRIPLGFGGTIFARVTPEKEVIGLTNLREIGTWLCEKRALPVAETMLADAVHLAGNHPPDLQRAILLAAIACEVKVKEALRTKAAMGIRPAIELLIQNPRDFSMPVAGFFDKAMAAATGRSLRTDNQALYKRVDRLFQIRNRIAHSGCPPPPEAADLINAAVQAFHWLDAVPHATDSKPAAMGQAQ